MTKICIVIMFITVLLSSGCTEEQEAQPVSSQEPVEAKTIVVAGDSLSAGYGVRETENFPYLLGEKLRAGGYSYSVVNAGVSGETSSGLLARLDWILTLNPDIVIVETGANDGLRGIDTGLVEKNIREIIGKLKERGIVVLLTGMRMVWNLGPLYVKEFNAIYPRLAEQYEVLFFPFFLQDVAMNAALNQQDGIHPNSEGYKIIAENIFPYVLKAIHQAD